MKTSFLSMLAAAALIPGTALAASEQAGIAAVVVGDVQVTPDGAGKKPAETGMDVNLGDRVQSEDNSRMQVLLLDETVFTVGPKSDLVIDRFVYDPKTNAGELAASFTKGVFRYVSGKIAKAQPQAVQIRVPTALIGIRGTAMFGAEDPQTGGMFYGLSGPGPSNNGELGAGGFTYTGENGESRDVSRAGFGILVQNGTPGPVIKTPDRIITSMQSQLTGGRAAGGEPAGRTGGGGNASDDSGQTQAMGQMMAAGANETLGDLAANESFATEATAQGASRLPSETPGGSLIAENLFEGRLPTNVAIPYAFQLTWNNISDVDLHVTGPITGSSSRFHVYYSNVGSYTASPYAVLDADRTGASSVGGSEVVGISNLMTGGIYSSFAFNFSDSATGSTSLSNTGNVVIKLLQNGMISRGQAGSAIINGTVLGTATASTGHAGNTYYGISLDPSTMAVTINNTFLDSTSSSTVGAID